MRHWLAKTEPTEYDWSTFIRERRAQWTGIRNAQARNVLKDMKTGDIVLIYHTGTERRVMGIAKVAKQAYQDPTDTEGKWLAIDLIPVTTLKHPISLETIKAHTKLQNIALVRQPRLSVSPLTEDEYSILIRLGA
ncbi:MAG TPA: EVE domain-containing protein [Bacteroidetes bacterium]|nr:EVE domain-containing protein [Bacteroidota bacterium]HRK05600.1 EVE domain-containing protein [Chlorobiota bacterium]